MRATTENKAFVPFLTAADWPRGATGPPSVASCPPGSQCLCDSALSACRLPSSRLPGARGRLAGWALPRRPRQSPLLLSSLRDLHTSRSANKGQAQPGAGPPVPMGVSLPALRDRASPLANRPKATFPNSYTNNKLDVFQFMKRIFLPLNIQIHIFENDI